MEISLKTASRSKTRLATIHTSTGLSHTREILALGPPDEGWLVLPKIVPEFWHFLSVPEKPIWKRCLKG